LNLKERINEDEIHRSLDTSSHLYFSSHFSDDVQKCATVDHMSDISSINKSIFGKKTRRRRLFFTFSLYRPWPWYSTTHARLTDYFNASATQISNWRHSLSKHIDLFVYFFKSSIKRKARVEYVDTFITSSSIKSLNSTNA
jgi:hypothetical protein